MAIDDLDTDRLIELAREGDSMATELLLGRHRDRLRKMVNIRIDRRLANRVDPSDVVQETLADAARRLHEYLRNSPLPFYPWLRRLAQEHIADAHRHHIQTQKRSVTRETHKESLLPDESAMELASQFIQSGTSPSHHLAREEVCDHVQAALKQLDPKDRDVIVMRYLEQMSNSEIAATLDITPAAANMRHLRALERIHDQLGEQDREYLS